MPTDFELLMDAKRGGERLARPKLVRLIAGKLHRVFLVGWDKASYRCVVAR